MAHFHGHQRLQAKPSGIILDISSALWAIRQVLHKGDSVGKGFKRLHASSLAFKTLLALIPALAIIMSVLANDTFSQKREQFLDQIVDGIFPIQTGADNSILDPSEPQNLQQLNQVGKQQIRISVRKFASHAQKVGLIGFVGFLIVVFLMLRDVEASFNFLWGVQNTRPLLTQMIRHAVFFIGLPLLVLILLTFKGWVGSWNLMRPEMHRWAFSVAFPFLALWFSCAWMYAWIPNAKVERLAAAYTGLMVAALLQIARWAMNWYAVKILAHSHVYGALWIIPVILIWFYLSWTVILFGAEVAFYIQKYRNELKR